MGFLRRRSNREASGSDSGGAGVVPGLARVATEHDFVELESEMVEVDVVGESSYQDALERIAGPRSDVGKQHRVGVTLRCEPSNAYDGNAIRIECMGQRLGYVPRDAAVHLAQPMAQRCGSVLEATGIIVGGWDDGFSAGSYGVRVWVRKTDLERIGVQPQSVRRASPEPRPTARGQRGIEHLDTGFAEAWDTDEHDDAYDLSWVSQLPDADRPAIAMLRGLLAQPGDAIDRHFQFAELERRLYHARSLYDTALEEFDEVCHAHDAEIEAMREAFIAKWGKVPRLELYRQAAIRKAKQHDWQSVEFWADRGIAIYGDTPAREAAVEDLIKRRNQARTKLNTAGAPRSAARQHHGDAVARDTEVAGSADVVTHLNGESSSDSTRRATADGERSKRSASNRSDDTTALAPAAWHSDPTGRFDHRYWDGNNWTEHVSRNGVASTDPL